MKTHVLAAGAHPRAGRRCVEELGPAPPNGLAPAEAGL